MEPDFGKTMQGECVLCVCVRASAACACVSSLQTSPSPSNSLSLLFIAVHSSNSHQNLRHLLRLLPCSFPLPDPPPPPPPPPGEMMGTVDAALQEKKAKQKASRTGRMGTVWDLDIKLISGKNLMPKDTVGEGTYGTTFSHSSDPYIVVRLADQRRQSKTIEKNLNPTWNETMTLRVTDRMEPLQVRRLCVYSLCAYLCVGRGAPNTFPHLYHTSILL